MPRPDSTSKQGLLPGFRQDPAGAMNFAGNYPRPWNLEPAAEPFEPPLGGNFVDGKIMMAPQSVSLPPPSPSPPTPSTHLSQLQRGRLYSGDASHDGSPGFGWQHEKCDSFGSGQD
ncbi:unnamed protein product [Fraxinus pennsylvanica]|uniref:Uncharacterized protein n=1 Tax=Fraxinus pennsylvanica TaxID=56036 RepID=A0AAD2A0K4_9LAMI|nr:unnamed protein product [Fraxinus pennsylvanica]